MKGYTEIYYQIARRKNCFEAYTFMQFKLENHVRGITSRFLTSLNIARLNKT